MKLDINLFCQAEDNITEALNLMTDVFGKDILGSSNYEEWYTYRTDIQNVYSNYVVYAQVILSQMIYDKINPTKEALKSLDFDAAYRNYQINKIYNDDSLTDNKKDRLITYEINEYNDLVKKELEGKKNLTLEEIQLLQSVYNSELMQLASEMELPQNKNQTEDLLLKYYEKATASNNLLIDYYNKKPWNTMTEEDIKQLSACQKSNEAIGTQKAEIINNKAAKEEALKKAKEEKEEYEQMAWWEKALTNTGTFVLSVGEGIVSVGEDIVDGAVTLGGGLVSYAADGLGFDEFSKSVKEGTENFVSYDFSGTCYDWIVDKTGLNEYSAYGNFHTAGNIIGTMAGYVGLSLIPGGALVTGGLSAVAAAGDASQRAFNEGATFDQAFASSAVAGTFGFGVGVGLNQVQAAAKGAASVGQVARYAAAGGGVAAIEPVANSVTQYVAYANDGSMSLSEFGDYYVKSGGLQSTIMAFGIGGISTGTASLKPNKQVNNVDDIQVDEYERIQNELTEIYSGRKAVSDEYISELQNQLKVFRENNLSSAYGTTVEFETPKIWGGDIDDATNNARLTIEYLKKNSNSYEDILESSKDIAHSLSKESNYTVLDNSMDLYHSDNLRATVEYYSWNGAQVRAQIANPEITKLPYNEQTALIQAEAKKMASIVESTPGATLREKLANSDFYSNKQIDDIVNAATANAKNASINGMYSLTGVNGAPRSHASINDYYLDMSQKWDGGLNGHITPEYRDYVVSGFKNSNSTNTVSSIYSNNNLKFAINTPGAKDSDILQLSMWDREPKIEVDMQNKSFGRVGDRQFVSPVEDSDTLFKNITNAKSDVNTQAVVGQATGLPTSGNDRLTRISIDTTQDVAIHNGTEAGSCKEALSGGLPVYEVEGKQFKMREATIESVNFADEDIGKLNLTVDNFDPDTGNLISTYKLVKESDGKTYLVLQ